MDRRKRDYGVEDVPEGHTDQEFGTAEFWYGSVQKIILKVNDEGIVEESLFKGTYEHQCQKEQ